MGGSRGWRGSVIVEGHVAGSAFLVSVKVSIKTNTEQLV